MPMRIVYWAVIAGALFAAGCGTVGGASPDASIASTDDAYFIIGVGPPDARLLIARGDVANGVVTRHNDAVSVEQVPFLGQPQGGYVVAKANAAGETLAIWKLQLADGNTYAPCNRGKAPVFTVPGGSIVYVGDLHFAVDREHVFGQFNTNGVRATRDLEAARVYLAAHYPALAPKLVDGRFELLWGMGCY